jgi:hypothetical protein
LKDTFAVKAIEIEGIKHIAVTQTQAKTIAKPILRISLSSRKNLIVCYKLQLH